MRRAALWMLMLVMLLGLTGCTALDELSRSDALPDLRLLERPSYQEDPPVETAPPAEGDLRLDLWLDATQVMGGINRNEESVYPHASRKYREGGFHYRDGSDTGMYETVLRCMLSAVEGSRVRLLRYGNERLPDDFLVSEGVVADDAAPETLRSVRRDMLTYAFDPMPTVFSSFSGEKMTDSFYSLGTPKLNRIQDLNARLLENPTLTGRMSDALYQQIRRIQKNWDDSLTDLADESDYPLLYALDNIDLSRLSVITCDPAAILRLSAVDNTGAVHLLVEELLNERGIFDAGLNVGLYAFTLDYMGQMSSFGAADLSEPLLWGRTDYNNYTGEIDGLLPMPRTLLTLVIGTPAQVDSFAGAFEAQLASSDVLKTPRGPQNGQLSYTANGQTVVQEPFCFEYEYMLISRAQVKQLSQYTPGASLAARDAVVSADGTLYTVTLSPVDGEQPNRTLTLTLPLTALSSGMTMDAAQLENISVTVENALLFSHTLPNSPDTVLPEDSQTIILRDKIHVYSSLSPDSPVSCTGLSSDGSTLSVQLQVDGSQLTEGYYRLLFSADLPADSMDWQTPAWIGALNAGITNEQIASWENFTQLLSRYERKRSYISRQYQHAWGDASNQTYYGEAVPDFPPVTLAPGLSELVRQLQNAAHPSTMPYIRFVFDLFVTNQP